MTRRFETERRRLEAAPPQHHRTLSRAVSSTRALLAGAGLLLAWACQSDAAPAVRSEPPRASAAAPVAAAATPTPSAGAPSQLASPGSVGLAKYQPSAPTGKAADAPVAHALAADAPAGKAAPGQPIQGAAVSEEPFSIWLQAVSPIPAGSASTVEAVLVAKPPYHCNAEYPHKFKLAAAPSGLAYPETTVKGAKVTAERSVLPIPVQAQSPGKAKVAGTLSFSVCDEERCLVEKRDLALELEVK
jgi:hypothetical protein